MHATDTLNFTKWQKWNSAVTQINAFQVESSQEGDKNSNAFKKSLICPDYAGLTEKVWGEVEENTRIILHTRPKWKNVLSNPNYQAITEAKHMGKRQPRA